MISFDKYYYLLEHYSKEINHLTTEAYKRHEMYGGYTSLYCQVYQVLEFLGLLLTDFKILELSKIIDREFSKISKHVIDLENFENGNFNIAAKNCIEIFKKNVKL